MDYEEVKTYFDFYISMPKIEIMKNNTNKINNMITSYSLNHGQIVPQIEYENRFDNDKLIKVRKLFEPYNCKLKYKYLDYYLNTKDKADSYLINLILEGYSDKLIDIKDTLTVEKRMERLDYELEQIHETSLQIRSTFGWLLYYDVENDRYYLEWSREFSWSRSWFCVRFP